MAQSDDLHYEDHGGDGCAEEGREEAAHTDEGQGVAVLVVELQKTAQGVGDAAAQLQCRSLAARGAAQEVGDEGGDKDQRWHGQREAAFVLDGDKEVVGAEADGLLEQVIEPHNQDTTRWQKK